MEYYVVLPNGRRDGPLTLDTLKLWVADGRLSPSCHIVSAETGQEIAGSEIVELHLRSSHTGDRNSPLAPEPTPVTHFGSGPTSNYTAAYGVALVAMLVGLAGGVGLLLGLLGSLAAIGLATNIRFASPRQVRKPLVFGLLALLINGLLWVIPFRVGLDTGQHGTLELHVSEPITH